MTEKGKSLPLVSINCIVFNHEPYIRDALEGFVGQKTDFAFEAVVHDDASTDGTAAIIREYAEKYPDIIKPIYETENQYSKRDGSLWRIMDAQMRGKYVAFCEGDDCWTDPHKLQEQVDYLEAHPECGMVYGQAQNFHHADKRLGAVWGGPQETFRQLLVNSQVPTLTVVMRTSLLKDYRAMTAEVARGWQMGDYPQWLYVAANSSVHFLPEVLGRYRVLAESASHSKDATRALKFGLNYREIAMWFADKYDTHLPEVNASYWIARLGVAIAQGDRQEMKLCRRQLAKHLAKPVSNKMRLKLAMYVARPTATFNYFQRRRAELGSR